VDWAEFGVNFFNAKDAKVARARSALCFITGEKISCALRALK
jgi:hypothetical protein